MSLPKEPHSTIQLLSDLDNTSDSTSMKTVAQPRAYVRTAKALSRSRPQDCLISGALVCRTQPTVTNRNLYTTLRTHRVRDKHSSPHSSPSELLGRLSTSTATSASDRQGPMSTMQLTDLPAELIASLPNYLHSLDDLYSLVGTSRIFCNTCANTSATFPPTFAKKYGQNLLPPHPHLLLAGTARQIADWAVQSERNRQELYDAITRGNEGLQDLAVQVARLSLNDVRALHQAKIDVVNPLSRVLDLECGQGERQRYRDDEESSVLTVCEDVDQALYNYLIYCELFHHSVDAALDPSMDIVPLSTELRMHWIAQCMPDNNCKASPAGKEYQMLDYQHMSQSDGFLNFSKIPKLLLGKPQALAGVNGPEYEGLSPQEILFVKVMEHQGLLTLRVLQADEATRQDLSKGIRNKAEAVPTAKIRLGPKYDEAGETQIGWFDITEDVSSSMDKYS